MHYCSSANQHQGRRAARTFTVAASRSSKSVADGRSDAQPPPQPPQPPQPQQHRQRAPRPPHVEYQRQRDDYAGANALIPADDDSLTPGHIVLVDAMSIVFRSFFGFQNREKLLNSKGEDVSVLHSVAHTVLVRVMKLPTLCTRRDRWSVRTGRKGWRDGETERRGRGGREKVPFIYFYFLNSFFIRPSTLVYPAWPPPFFATRVVSLQCGGRVL